MDGNQNEIKIRWHRKVRNKFSAQKYTPERSTQLLELDRRCGVKFPRGKAKEEGSFITAFTMFVRWCSWAVRQKHN